MKFPYFKNYVKDWLSGSIQNCDLTTKAIFNELMNLYWQQDCDLKYDPEVLANRCKIDAKTFENSIKLLKTFQILFVKFGKIKIKFLETQFNEKLEKQKIYAQNGQLGGVAKGLANATLKYSKEPSKKSHALHALPEPVLIKKETCKEKSLIAEKSLTPELFQEWLRWLDVWEYQHGNGKPMNMIVQERQLEKLLRLPESIRAEALKLAIDSQWKNICDIRESSPLSRQQGEKNGNIRINPKQLEAIPSDAGNRKIEI